MMLFLNTEKTTEKIKSGQFSKAAVIKIKYIKINHLHVCL